VLDRLGFFGYEGFSGSLNYPENHPANPRYLVATMVRAITAFADIVQGNFVVDTLERSMDDVEGLRIRTDARGATLTFDGFVAVNYEGRGKLKKNILDVPGWVAYYSDMLEEDEAVNDFHTAGERDPRIVGMPVDGLSWDFRISDFDVAVVKHYSWSEIERAAGSREAFFDILVDAGATMT
jgi:hypothetical protein